MSEPGVLEQLNKASSAEDFFALLGVDYDPKLVNVARLHILRRMGQYLVSEDFAELDDATVTERCKDVLEQAYRISCVVAARPARVQGPEGRRRAGGAAVIGAAQRSEVNA